MKVGVRVVISFVIHIVKFHVIMDGIANFIT